MGSMINQNGYYCKRKATFQLQLEVHWSWFEAGELSRPVDSLEDGGSSCSQTAYV